MKRKLTAQLAAAYIGCPILICEPDVEPVSHYLEGVDICSNKAIAERVNYSLEHIRLVLTPLFAITDEHSLNLCKIARYSGMREADAEVGRQLVANYWNKVSNVNAREWVQVINYLRSLYYDCDELIEDEVAIDSMNGAQRQEKEQPIVEVKPKIKVAEAIQWNYSSADRKRIEDMLGDNLTSEQREGIGAVGYFVKTAHGVEMPLTNYYIIKNIDGSFDVIHPDIFKNEYEL